jgi:hypothetical protein
LIDGYKRVKALQKLGMDTVEALLLPMDGAEALVYGLREGKTRNRSALEEGWWIRELVEQHNFNLDRISIHLHRSKSWVSRRLALVNALPESVQAMVRKGKICPHAAMRYLVPLARANRGACQRLAEHIGNEALSARQLGILYGAWRRAQHSERVRIEDNPLLYLKTLEELQRSQASFEHTDEGTMFKDLVHLVGLCQRINARLRQGSLTSCAETLTKNLQKQWQQTLLSFETLRDAMEEWIHAGEGRAHGDL